MDPKIIRFREAIDQLIADFSSDLNPAAVADVLAERAEQMRKAADETEENLVPRR
jgi:hypothetical protein